MSTTLVMLAVNVVAIAILVLGIYFPRHRCLDLVVAFFAVNMGVFDVAAMLAGTDVGMGLGLGLFGALSIIRLRSSEISQCEVSYYFAALAIGLINGMSTAPTALEVIIVAAIIVTLAVADSSLLFGQYRSQEFKLDHAYTTNEDARAAVAALVGTDVYSVTVTCVDLVNDTTRVTARFRASDTETQPVRDTEEEVMVGALR